MRNGCRRRWHHRFWESLPATDITSGTGCFGRTGPVSLAMNLGRLLDEEGLARSLGARACTRVVRQKGAC